MAVKDTVSKARESMIESYRATRDKAEESYEAAAARTGEFYANARERAGQAGRRTADAVDSNPIAAVIGGLGIGMLLGALLPRTRRESELMGSYGGKITSRAREAAEAARAVGQEKLDELGFVKENARETAKKLMDTAKEAASEAKAAAAEKARGSD